MKNFMRKLTLVITLILLVLTFTPLVIPYHRFTPMVWGMPYSLWISFLITLAMLFNIFLATRYFPGDKK